MEIRLKNLTPCVPHFTQGHSLSSEPRRIDRLPTMSYFPFRVYLTSPLRVALELCNTYWLQETRLERLAISK